MVVKHVSSPLSRAFSVVRSSACSHQDEAMKEVGAAPVDSRFTGDSTGSAAKIVSSGAGANGMCQSLLSGNGRPTVESRRRAKAKISRGAWRTGPLIRLTERGFRSHRNRSKASVTPTEASFSFLPLHLEFIASPTCIPTLLAYHTQSTSSQYE